MRKRLFWIVPDDGDIVCCHSLKAMIRRAAGLAFSGPYQTEEEAIEQFDRCVNYACRNEEVRKKWLKTLSS